MMFMKINVAILAVAFVVCAAPSAKSKAEELESLPEHETDIWKISEWMSRRGWNPTERAVSVRCCPLELRINSLQCHICHDNNSESQYSR